MKAKLTRVGPFGVQTDQTGDKWLSNGKGKYEVIKDIKSNFSEGNEVEVVFKENGNYLNLVSMTKLNNINGTTTETKARSYETDPEDALRMSRSTATTAVFGGGVLAAIVGNMDISEAVSTLKGLRNELAEYILNGDKKDESTKA